MPVPVRSPRAVLVSHDKRCCCLIASDETNEKLTLAYLVVIPTKFLPQKKKKEKKRKKRKKHKKASIPFTAFHGNFSRILCLFSFAALPDVSLPRFFFAIVLLSLLPRNFQSLPQFYFSSFMSSTWLSFIPLQIPPFWIPFLLNSFPSRLGYFFLSAFSSSSDFVHLCFNEAQGTSQSVW